jgi:ribosomal protein L37AE/L43A
MLGFKFTCKNCGANFEIRDPYAQKTNYLQCPSCNVPFAGAALPYLRNTSINYSMISEEEKNYDIELFEFTSNKSE